MALPGPVENYLNTLLAGKMRPFTIQIDAQFRLVSWWGDGADCGFGEPEKGSDVRDDAPFLHSLDVTSTSVLRFVNTSASGVFHVHVVPAGDVFYVVFMPVGDEQSTQRGIQQMANDVRLMNHRQKRLLEQLTEAKAEIEERERETARANAVKSRFIAGMSHEFRTPLTSVLGYAELILDQTREDHDLAAHAEAIGRAARHLLSMADNVLDQARLEDGNVVLHMAPVNIRHVTDDLAAIMAPLAAEKFLGFAAFVDTDVPEYCMTDIVRLRQVLLNVIGNAVKYTDQGEVRLEIAWRDGVLTADVIDTGPGIPAAEKEKIFAEFQRGSSSAGKRGTGLGLNITKRLLQLLEGGIDVTSEPGVGSRFTIRVPAPASRTEVSAAPETPSPRRSARGDVRILVAEDDPDIVQLMQIMLGRAGYLLTIASDGHQAVERTLTERPDLVLMDVNMPGLNGLKAAQTLRERGFSGPIVALTASLGADDRDKAYASGCDGYLAKPISSSELLSAIERYLAPA